MSIDQILGNSETLVPSGSSGEHLGIQIELGEETLSHVLADIAVGSGLVSAIAIFCNHIFKSFCNETEHFSAGELSGYRAHRSGLVGVRNVAEEVDEVEVTCRAQDLALTDVLLSFALEIVGEFEKAVVDSTDEVVAESDVDDKT